jgi:ATP-dependent DNA ligase
MILTKKNKSSSSDKEYTTNFDTEIGRGTCNCPGWTKRAVRECKHTKELAAEAAKAGAALPAAKPDPVTPFDKVQDAGGFQPPDIKPMLASAMPEGKNMSDFSGPDYVMEEKFDGHRLSVIVRNGKVTAWSRPGSDRPGALRPLPPALVAQLAQLPEGQYDGELCIPGGTSSDVTRLDLKDKLVFVAFDAVEIMGTDLTALTLTARRAALELAIAHAPKGGRVVCAAQGPVSMDTVRAIWAAGGEGAIIKRLDSTYRSGWRTPNWIKVKKIGAAELTITGYEAAVRGPHACFKLKHDDGRETTVKVLTDDLLRRVDADPQSFVGRRVTISFMGLTPTGTWRHPIFDHFTEGD